MPTLYRLPTMPDTEPLAMEILATADKVKAIATAHGEQASLLPDVPGLTDDEVVLQRTRSSVLLELVTELEALARRLMHAEATTVHRADQAEEDGP